MRLPVLDATSAVAVVEASGGLQARSLEGVKVLLVEHDDDARELARTILESSGAKVSLAGSARSALAAMETTRPDVLVTAIGLPDQDGCALLREVRTRDEGKGNRLPAVAAHRWMDRTSHLRFDPVELLERLAVLIPRPRINLILYHGVLAPRASLRSRVVGCGQPGMGAPTPTGESGAADAEVAGQGERGPAGPTTPARPSGQARLWADLMRRTCSPVVCPGTARSSSTGKGRRPSWSTRAANDRCAACPTARSPGPSPSPSPAGGPPCTAPRR